MIVKMFIIAKVFIIGKRIENWMKVFIIAKMGLEWINTNITNVVVMLFVKRQVVFIYNFHGKGLGGAVFKNQFHFSIGSPGER